jgi:hypothetical protein
MLSPLGSCFIRYRYLAEAGSNQQGPVPRSCLGNHELKPIIETLTGMSTLTGKLNLDGNMRAVQ